MTTYLAVTSSNEARVCKAHRVRALIDRYFWDNDVQAILRDDDDGQSFLSIAGDDWPVVWRMPNDIDPADFVPDWDQDSDEEFDRFLRELAPFLAEPLTIQAIGAETSRYPLAASEWRLKPGSTRVRITSFRRQSALLVS